MTKKSPLVIQRYSVRFLAAFDGGPYHLWPRDPFAPRPSATHMTSPLEREQPGHPFSAPPPVRDVGANEGDLAGRYWDRVRLFAMRRLRDATSAEDVAQETLRVVTEALRGGRVESIEALRGYVFRTAQYLCLQRIRSFSREAKAMDRLGNQPGPDEAANDPLVAIISEERRHSVRRALDGLAPADRQLLTLLYFDEVDSAVAADRLGVTPEALRVRKHRAIRRLGVLLGEEREDVTP